MSQNASSQSTERQGWFLRPTLEASDYMGGSFNLNGLESFIYLDTKGCVTVHKRLKDGSASAKPIASGQVRRNKSSNPDAPALLGTIRTGKNTKFAIAFWWYPDKKSTPRRPYYVVRYDDYERPEPKGAVVSPDMLPA